MSRLTDKRAIVTGAASGIGRASAKLFAAEGAKVLAVDVNDNVHETVADIIGAGGIAHAVIADAAQEVEVEALVGTALEELGGLDVFYANAGISGRAGSPFFEQSRSDWEQILAVNLIGPLLAVKHAGAHMASQGKGAIVMTASVAGLRANAGGVIYAASKAGVISLAQTAANELLGTGVRVNAVCPGLIETGMTKPLFDRARERGTQDRIGQLNPLQRNGEPEEIAAMALFLASDDASYVNGQAVAVDGGLSSTHPFVPSRRS
jgi:NAD(P)-dependent dehydrogenase (short-subunit alcohol dehydrogenase family)